MKKALPENVNSGKNEVSVKKHEISHSKGNAVGTEDSFFSKMFDNIEKNARSEKTISDNRKAINDFLSRQDTSVDQRRLIRKIADNTDTIIDVLKDLKLQGDQKNGLDWKSMLPAALPIIAGMIAAAMPENMKPYQTLAKAAPVIAKGAGKAAQLASNSVDAAKAAKLAKEASTGAEIVKDTSNAAGALGTAAKALGKVGSTISDSPIVNKAIRYTGVGMTAGRVLEGDYTGAAAEAGSLALHEASRKAKSPKAKALLTAASLGTDAGILIRDYFNGQEEKDRAAFAKQNGIVAPEKESASTRFFGMFGVETDQAKRIKEQNAALTPEAKAALESYDASQNSGFEKLKNIAGDALPFAAMAAMPFAGKLFSKGGLTSKIADTVIGGNKDPIVESGEKFADIVVEAAKSFKDGGPIGAGRRGRGGRNRGKSGSTIIDGDFKDITPSNRPQLPSPGKSGSTIIDGDFKDITPSNRPSGNARTTTAKIGTSLSAVGDLKSKLPSKLTGIGVKGIGSLGAKAIPGVGLALGAYGAASRISDGDYLGALGEVASGLAATVPVVGTAASIAIQGGLMYRDAVTESNEETTELNSITRDSVSNLDAAAKTNAEQLNSNTALIEDTNKTIVKNSSDSTSLISKTGSTLASFTENLGTNIKDWLLKGGSIFSLAFTTMNAVKMAIGSALSKIGLDKLNPFKNETGNGNGAGNGQIDYRLDTSKGQFDLGKHGGTMTSSIFKGESGGNYGVYNVSNGKGGWNKGSVNNANTTLDQIISAQSARKMNAFGAYQIIGTTMKEAKTSLGLKGNEKMTAELQDRIYQDYLIKKKRKAIFNYITGKDNNLNTAVLAGAMEWASIGVPHDMKGANGPVKKGQSYYNGVAGNKAHITPEEFGLGLQQQKSRYLALKKKGLSDDEAYHQSFKKQAGGVAPMEAAGELAGAIGSAKDTVKSWFSKDKKDSGNVVTKSGNVIPATLARPQNTNQNITPSKQNATNIVKNAEKSLGINKAAAGAAGTAGAAATGSIAASSSTKNEDKIAKADWDLDVLCRTAVANAQKGSTKDCALYVRKALEKAQTKKIFTGGLGHAKDYMKSLPRIGWSLVGKNAADIKKGDIAVFPKSSTSHDYGHVCIFTGKYWVSDFVQRQVQPSSKSNWDYYVFRAKSGYTNGSPENASPTDIEKAAAAAGGTASLGGSETSADSTGVEENKNPIDKAIDAAIAGIAPLAAAFGNSEVARAALDWVNSAKVDEYKQRNVDKADLRGFNFNSAIQKRTDKYKFGNGGDYNEMDLFNPNLDRQKGSSIDHLGEAGKIPGVVRQKNSMRDLLGEAGYIPGVVRQQDHGTEIGTSKIKKRKKKWYDRIFGSSNSGLFGDIASMFGLGDIFGLGQEIYSADKSGNLKDYGINKVFDVMGNDAELSQIGNIGREIYNADKQGNLKDYAINKFINDILNPSSVGFNPNEQLSLYSSTSPLSPNIVEKEKINGYISGINQQYIDMKNGNNKKNVSSQNMTSTSVPPSGSNGKSGNLDGMSTTIVTRNPDSIFREMSINIMKTTMT